MVFKLYFSGWYSYDRSVAFELFDEDQCINNLVFMAILTYILKKAGEAGLRNNRIAIEIVHNRDI